jgi:alkanesulfonate monooxygenase SsuD/methylene tetrahydromethanopterin reductase-like flavin-dependent oxidoreductase (luciferase family)
VDPTETQPQWEEVLRLLPKMWTQRVFEGWESKYIKLPPRRVTPQPIQKPFPPMWVASTQPYSVEFAGKNGLGCLGFGVSDAHCTNYVQMYREAIRQAKPEHGILRVALCTPTDDVAIALQEPNHRLFYEQVTGLFAPWLEGKPPPTYEYIIQSFTLLINLSYAGVDEVLLFMQGATTPHDKILDSIRLLAKEVRPQLKRT